jgi:hypothetical protein
MLVPEELKWRKLSPGATKELNLFCYFVSRNPPFSLKFVAEYTRCWAPPKSDFGFGSKTGLPGDRQNNIY